MDVEQVIQTRRAYRSIDPEPLTNEELKQLETAVQLAPSCFNNQPWRFVFVTNENKRNEIRKALSKGNQWAYHASMYVVVCARKQDDCVIHDREYYLFDTGIATGFLVLQATELGFVAHPIAGYSPKMTRHILDIPDDMQVIALVIIGKHADKIRKELTEKQREIEKDRPKRKKIKEIIYYNKFEMN
ncbi:MAG: nitroreductase family protein [Candidatus Thermoplasmatota archaeon]|nr:nitroreductase family protein [Candidatus Thermoplasmatota archaeon]